MLSRFGQEIFLNNWTIEEAAHAAGGWEYLTGGQQYDPDRDQYDAAGLDTEYDSCYLPWWRGEDDDEDVEDWWGEDDG